MPRLITRKSHLRCCIPLSPLAGSPFSQVPYRPKDAFDARTLIDFRADGGPGAVPLGHVLRGVFVVLAPEALEQDISWRGMLDSGRPTLHMHFPGYRDHKPQIYLTQGHRKAPVNLGQLLLKVAEETDKYMERIQREICAIPGLDIETPVVTIEKVLLTGVEQIGRARIRPVLELLWDTAILD